MTLSDYLKPHGNATRIAKAVGVTHSAVLQWARGRVPAERVLRVEEATGISRHELRPDLYPESRQAQ